MNIAINAWLLRKKALDGIGVFTKETVSRIIRDHPEHRFYVLLDKGFSADYFDFPNASKHLIFPALRHPVLYVLYLETVLPRFLKQHHIDLLICPDGMLSLRSSCPQVPVIHDLNFVHQPRDLNFRNRLYYNFFYGKFARKAHRIATVSRFSKRDIEIQYGIHPDKIDVVYCGIKEEFRPFSAAEQAAVRERYSGGKAYFLFVGSIHPRKNVVRLVEAFNAYKNTSGNDTRLLLVGNFMWDDQVFRELQERLSHKADIILAGYMSDSELSHLYASALALTFVPTFEGFGIPVVEAFASGTPVICSNVTSLPEVAGDAALLVNPLDVTAIAAAMQRMATDHSLREKLTELGLLQAKMFSWDYTAGKLWDCCMIAVRFS